MRVLLDTNAYSALMRGQPDVAPVPLRRLLPALTALALLATACERLADAPRRPSADGPGGDSLTVAEIFAPFGQDGVLLGDVSWGPDGEAVAFLLPVRHDSLTGEEVLELWLADPATGARRRLAGPEDLLGGPARQTFSAEEAALRERLRLSARGITDYRWSPDGSRILVPLSGDLFELDVATADARRLTDTPGAEFDPRYAPDGTRIAFVRDGELYALDLASGRERRLTTGATETVRHGVAEFIAQEELGRTRGFWWSPNGRRIAYTRVDETAVPVHPLVDFRSSTGDLRLQRYPRPGEPNATVRLLVVPAGGGVPLPMNVPSGPDWYLARVGWHPNERDLVVQMMPRDQDSIRVLLVDAATGAARPFFVESSERWVDLHDDLTWLPDGDFLWTSDRTGFRHVYRFGPDGAPRHPVTRGEWPVAEVAAVDADSGWVYFTGFADGPFQRHLYRAPLDSAGGVARPQRVSREPGWHTPLFGPDRRRYLDTWSRATRPPSVAVYDAATGERATWIEENRMPRLEELALVQPEFLWIHPVDRAGAVRPDSLPAMLTRPAGFDSGRQYPVVVYTYGGPGAQVVKDDWLTRGRGLWHQLLAQRGFFVWSCDGRGSGARGRAWVDPVYGRLATVETGDQADCVRALWRREAAADSARTGIWGWSFGGTVAVSALAQDPEVWAAAAAVAPVTDWTDYDTAYTERYMETPAANAEGYRETAPVRQADSIVDPLFLAWGLTDDNVHPVHSVRLVDALIAAGRPPDVLVFPGRGHAIGDPPARRALYRALTDFFVRTLKEDPGS